GYDREKSEAVVTAIVKDGEEAARASQGDTVDVVLNQTVFYGESGGQQGDRGAMRGDRVAVSVNDTQKRAEGVFVHRCVVEEGSLAVGDALELTIDVERRAKLRSNHSATHLVHEALREVLGDHVAQKGSLVAEERLRFDFSHPKTLAAVELREVADISNEMVLQNSPVVTRLMPIDEARETGAMALFGEKYGDEVRVVSMGTATRGAKVGRTYSVELCGGTHVRATGDIGLVSIVGESAVSAGVRRIEALTGDAARKHLEQQDAFLRRAADAMKASPADVPMRVKSLMEERKKLERELAEARKALAMAGPANSAGGAGDTDTINGIAFAGRIVSGVSPKDLKPMADDAKQQLGSGVVALIATGDDGKASIVAAVTDDLTDKVSAVDLVRAASAAVGGKGGGGRPDMAQAGGPDGDKAGDALAAIRDALAG
ncbi:MAG: DHHA1 domain-containing protein, partial [Pseudomonadota bacterium]